MVEISWTCDEDKEYLILLWKVVRIKKDKQTAFIPGCGFSYPPLIYFPQSSGTRGNHGGRNGY